jgi:hypothetical protein
MRAEPDHLGLDRKELLKPLSAAISSDERNRVYINNQPSTVSALRDLFHRF